MKNFFRMGYEAFWKGERCPEDATPEQAEHWKQGRDHAVHEAMLHEYRT